MIGCTGCEGGWRGRGVLGYWTDLYHPMKSFIPPCVKCSWMQGTRNNAWSWAVTYRGFFFCRYKPWSMLLHHMHAPCTLHHSHEMLHGSHKTLHFLHETILAQFSYETVYIVWNTLNSFIHIILLYSILWTRCDMMIFYCHHTCPYWIDYLFTNC